MRIGIPQLAERDGLVRAEVDFDSAAGRTTLWFGVAPAYTAALATERADGFLVALLLLAMQSGEDIRVDAPVSTRLLYNLRHHYQPLVGHVLPQLRPVRIDAEADHTPLATAGGVGTGFSAGVDSFSVIRDHFVEPVPPGFRLTHLTFHNVGSHGVRDPARARALFHARHAEIARYPHSVGLPFIAVDSNLSDILRLDFEQTHTTRNLAVALVMQKLLRRFYYASTFYYRDTVVRPYYDSAVVDPIAVPLLATDTLDLIATGSQYTRVEKTRLITTVPGIEHALNVCARGRGDGRNCSHCIKCCRTLFTLELLGQVERFGACFDLDVWRRERNRYITTSLLAPHPKHLTREILAHMHAIGYRLTPRQHATALLLRAVPRPLYKLGRSLRRRWRG
jgi:hypothetical protein